MNENILREIGLTESEKNVYVALLELGDSTRGNIVNRSKVAGSKIYELLEKLQEKGLVSIYIKNKVKHFKPTNPTQILNYLQEKKQEIINVEQQTKLILPALLDKFNASKEDQEVELISGMRGLEIIFREQVDSLKKGETCYVIGGTWGTMDTQQSVVKAFFHKILIMRQKKGIHTKMLFNKSEKESTEEVFSSIVSSVTKIRYIEHASPVAINIYKDRTIIIIFGSKITSIYITSRDVANSFLEYFDLLWKQAK